MTAEYNDLGGVQTLFAQYPDEIAAVIVEPIAANMGFVLPAPGFLQGLQDICQHRGALFILDEVMTGFRVAPGGAQSAWGLDPDITCLGKVIGGGLPVGAYGGKRDIMRQVAPAGPMYQAGTLSGNPLAMTAGLATLDVWLTPGVFEATAEQAARLSAGIQASADAAGIPLQSAQVGTMFGFYFLTAPDAAITDYPTARQYADTQRYARFFHAMLEQGVYFAPSQFEAAFMSSAHTEADIADTISKAAAAMGELAAGGGRLAVKTAPKRPRCAPPQNPPTQVATERCPTGCPVGARSAARAGKLCGCAGAHPLGAALAASRLYMTA